MVPESPLPPFAGRVDETGTAEDRWAAVLLVGLTAAPAVLLAVPAAAAVWLFCGNWGRIYSHAYDVLHAVERRGAGAPGMRAGERLLT